jgi:hypothetical protein
MFTSAVETTADFLSRAEPSMTALVASRPAQHVEWVGPRPPVGVVIVSPKPIKSSGSTAELGTASAGPSTQADLAIAQLIRLERLDANWDGNDTAKPVVGSLKDAKEFIRALAPESSIPRATLHADGNALLFLHGPDVYAELEFFGNRQIGFYARRGGQEWSDEITFDGRTLPQGLSRIGLVT